MLFMSYPFRNEKKHLSGSPPTYSAKPAEPGEIEVANQNCSFVEPIAAIAHDAFKRISSDIDKVVI